MAEIVGIIVNVLECICSTPTNNCIYQERNFNDDVVELRRKLKNLNSREEDLLSKIQVEAGGGKMVKQEVEEWLKHVQDINVDVQAILEEVQRVTWYNRFCLDILVCREIIVVEGIHERGSFPKGLVIQKDPPHKVIISTENLVVQTSTKEEIWEYLMGDEVGRMGVCRKGGVGKPTVIKNIYNVLLRKTRFQKVIWVTISYPCADVSILFFIELG